MAQINNAWRVAGAYRGDTMVGFARAVSDGVDIAYLADVFVDPAHRGRGVGAELVRSMLEVGDAHGLRWLLQTANGHEFYKDLGFTTADASVMTRPTMAEGRELRWD